VNLSVRSVASSSQLAASIASRDHILCKKRFGLLGPAFHQLGQPAAFKK
jgi:hypothetical protein